VKGAATRLDGGSGVLYSSAWGGQGAGQSPGGTRVPGENSKNNFPVTAGETFNRSADFGR